MIRRIVQLFILVVILAIFGVIWYGCRQSTPIIEPVLSKKVAVRENTGISKDFFEIPSEQGGIIQACLVTMDPSKDLSPTQNRVRDALKIRGKLPLVGSQPQLVLICTSWDQGLENSMEMAEGLSAAGYSCLVWSPRPIDPDQFVYCTYGLKESLDVPRLIDEAYKRLGTQMPVSAVGQSFGASVMLNAAAHDTRIRSVVCLDGITSLKSAVMDALAQQYGKYASMGMFWLIDFWVQKRAGFSCFEVAPVDDARKLNIPVMFVHTNQHYLSEMEDSVNLYECVNHEGRALYGILLEGEPYGLKERDYVHIVEGKKGEKFEKHYTINVFDGDDELQANMAEWIYENTKMPMPKVLEVEPGVVN